MEYLDADTQWLLVILENRINWKEKKKKKDQDILSGTNKASIQVFFSVPVNIEEKNYGD